MTEASGFLRKQETVNFAAYEINFVHEKTILKELSVIDKQKQKRHGQSRNKILFCLLIKVDVTMTMDKE